MTIKRIVLLTIPTTISFICLAVGYVFSLRQIAVQSNELLQERCTTINPPLIMYKKAFLQFANVVNSGDKSQAQQGAEYVTIYLDGIKAYENVEREWLQKAKEFQSNPAFTLLYPDPLRALMKYQWEIYNAYYEEAVYMRLVSEGKVQPNSEWDQINAIRAKRYEYQEKADDQNKYIYHNLDLRYKIINLPKPTECTDENTIIPATEGAIDWGEEATPSSEPVPTLLFGA